MRGRYVVLGMLIVGVALAAIAAVMRGRGEPRLPLQPGTILLVTAEQGAIDLGPLAAGAITFERAHGVSSDRVATLGAIVTGRMPRENGLVREGDEIAREIPVLGELLREARFVGAAFWARAQPLTRSGAWRGCATVDEDSSGRSEAILARAGDWLLARGIAPSFCHLHLERADPSATAALFTRLHEHGVDARLVVAAISLEDPAVPSLALRLPPGLLPAAVGAGDVSLLDVAPSLLELFGIAVPPTLMEPFLLDPRRRTARFFLFTRPLAPPPDEPGRSGDREDLLGCDAVELLAGGLRYSLDPRVDPPERCDDPRAIGEMRRLLESAWGYRLEESPPPPRARFVGRGGSR